MKKIVICICLTLLSTFLFTACSSKITEKSENQSNIAVNENLNEAKGNTKSFEDYISLLGITKDKLIEELGENPTLVDEGGLEFQKARIRVWFTNDQSKVAEQIYIERADVDYKGLKIGDKISEFKGVFGTPEQEDTQSAYANFNYKGIVLNINYDSKTEKTISAYVMREWK